MEQVQEHECQMAETVLMLVRFGAASVLECRNSFSRNKGMLKTAYHGKVIGFGSEISLLECCRGYWNGTHSLAILEFENAYWAQQWFEGSPDIRQPDWLHGTDVVMVPIREHIPTLQKHVVLIDAHVRCSQTFEDYAQKVKETLKSKGAAPAVLATKSYRKFRGLWDPSYLLAHFLSDPADLQTITATEEGQEMENLRRKAAECDVLTFEIIPL